MQSKMARESHSLSNSQSGSFQTGKTNEERCFMNFIMNTTEKNNKLAETVLGVKSEAIDAGCSHHIETELTRAFGLIEEGNLDKAKWALYGISDDLDKLDKKLYERIHLAM